MNAKRISVKILSGIDYLHSLNPPIIHRDIKCDNILLDENDDPILIDFGLSYKTIDDSTNLKTLCKKPFWASPDVNNQEIQIFSEKTDIYSFGCTIFEMIVGWESYSKKENNQPNLQKLPDNLTISCRLALGDIIGLEQNFKPDSKDLQKLSWFNESLPPIFQSQELTKSTTNTTTTTTTTTTTPPPPSPSSSSPSMNENKKIVTSDCLINSFKESGCLIFLNGELMYDNPFDKDCYQYNIVIPFGTPHLREVIHKDKNKSKHLDKIELFIDDHLAKGLVIKLGNFKLDLSKEFKKTPTFRDSIIEYLLDLLQKDNDDDDDDVPESIILNIAVGFYKYISNFITYQYVLNQPSHFC